MKRGLFLVILLAVCAFDKKPIIWVALGDSITYLNDHPDETAHRITQGYMTQVVAQLPHLKYVNKGYNGWTASRIAQQIDNLNLVSADVYSVFLGTNDWWQGKPVGTLSDYQNNRGPETLYGSFRVIIDKLKSLNPNAKIILITPMQRGDFVYVNDFKNNAHGSYKPKNGQWLAQFAEAIADIGHHEGLDVIDLYHKRSLSIEKMTHFKRLKDPQTGQYRQFKYPITNDIPFDPVADEYPYPVEASQMTFDGLHPSDEGYKVIAKMLVKVMKKV
jgi:lysophospholipase L1-like esterase